MTPNPSEPKPLRADARRNRARLLEVAEAVFAAKGTSASTEEIARAAGVGIGTVFRHFPTKEALLGAVLVGRLQRLAEQADLLVDAEDPGAAFFTFFTTTVEQSVAKNAFIDALTGAGVDIQDVTTTTREHLRRVLTTLLDRAQVAGAVRADVRAADLPALLVGASRAVEHAGSDGPARDRVLAVVLDGLRPAR